LKAEAIILDLPALTLKHLQNFQPIHILLCHGQQCQEDTYFKILLVWQAI